MIYKKRGRLLSIFLAVILVLSMFAGSIGSAVVYAGEKSTSKYGLNDSPYGNRLYNHLGDIELEINFEFKDAQGNKLFNKEVAEKFNRKAKIQINDGKVMSFKEAGLENGKAWDGPVFHTWSTSNRKFLRTFANDDVLKVKIWDYDNHLIEGTLKNNLEDEDREKLMKDDEDTDVKPDEGEKTAYVINKNEYMTRLENDGYDQVEPKLEISFKTKDESNKTIYTEKDAEKLAKDGYISINGGEKIGFNKAGLVNTKAWNGIVYESWNTTNKDFIRSFIEDDELKVVIYLKDKVVAEGNIPNKITKEDRERFIKEFEPEPETESYLYKVKAYVMHSANGDTEYVYKDKSMAGAVLKEDAEMLVTEDGCKLILHYNATKIMGTQAYCTGFELTTKPFAVMKEGEKGDIASEFVMCGNNDAVQIVDLPEAEDAVYEGYIYSNIMGNTAALKVADMGEKLDLKDQLKELVKETKEDTEGETYYSDEDFKKALEEAEKATGKYGEKYVNLVVEKAKLREKKVNPFADGELFFVPVEASSTFANPPGTSFKVLMPWARVTVEDGKTYLNLEYGNYISYNGKAAVKNVTIYDRDGKTPLKVDFKRNKDDDTATLKMEMTYYPESGIYRTVLTDLEGEDHDSDLTLDYGNIHKGMMPALLREEITRIDCYQTNWIGPYDGKISQDRKHLYTEESFNPYLEVLNRCEDDLLPENRKDLTQDIIDKDIKDLRQASKNLIYKAEAGSGNNVNFETKALNNPGNVYTDDQPHILPAPWCGSRIYFGGKIYKVLNNGMTYDYESETEEDTGKLMIMADNFSVMQPWSKNNGNTQTWDESWMREYLNGDFYKNLGKVEQSLVMKTTLETRAAKESLGTLYTDSMSEAVKTEDKVFILDVDEMKSAEFGLIAPETRRTGSFYLTRNLCKDYFGDKKLTGVKPKGNMEIFNQSFDRPTDVYPAMNLDKKKILMTLQADVKIPEGIEKPEKVGSNLWKLVVRDESTRLKVDSITGSTVKYSATDNGGHIYAVVTDESGSITGFGKVGTAENGKAKIELSDKIYSEGDNINLIQMKEKHGTWYSSDLIPLDFQAADQLQQAKEVKLKEIESLVLSDKDKDGMTDESIIKAEQELKKLKDAAKKKVEMANTVNEVDAVKVDMERVKALLEEKTDPANPEPPIYKVIEGNNQKVNITKGESIQFRFNADYSLFENGGKVYVDGNLLKPDHYTSKAGSTIITLKKDYLKTLSYGEHTMKVTFSDGGEAIAKFKLTGKETKPDVEKPGKVNKSHNNHAKNSPKTGDDSTAGRWVLVIVLAVAVIATMLTRKKKK